MDPKIINYIKDRPKEADVLVAQWQEFARQNPEVLSFDTSDEFYAWAANHPGTDTSVWTGWEIQEAYFNLRNLHEDSQMQTQGEVNPSIVPTELIALPLLALAFRDRPKIMEDDKDYQKIVEQHKKSWLEKNPGKDFTSKEGLDYLHGSLDNDNAPTLKKDAEQAFRNNPKFKKRVERYDKESKKIYKNIDDDPRVIRTRGEIETHIKARQEYLKTHEEDKKPEDVSRIVQKQSWERFVRKHPEKAKTYGQGNIDIKKAYEKQEIKKQLSDLEQKTGRQVRYVEKVHRPQGMGAEEATRRLESITPSQPPPTLPERRTTIPQAVVRRFAPPGRRAALSVGRLGTRLVTQASLAAGRALVGTLVSNPIGWIVLGVIFAIGLAVFLIIMFLGGGGGIGGGGIQPIDCTDSAGNPIVVADGNACAVNTAAYYSNQTGTSITAACLDKCTDTVSVICDRNTINTCTSPDASCGTMETFCIQYSPPPPPSAAWLYDCNSAVFDYTFFASCSGSGIITPAPTPVLPPGVTPTPIPTPTLASTPTPVVTPTLTPTPTPVPPTPTGVPTNFSCTQFIGYSQTDNWYGEFEAALGATAASQYQLLWNGGGAMVLWQDPNYSGWNNARQSPCTQNATVPDRVVLDITHNQYLSTGNVGSDPVGFMENIIRNAITTTRDKYASVTQFVLQPVVGAPNHTDTCPASSPAEFGVVRATYNHPVIYQAIDRVVASPPAGVAVMRGFDNHVGDCSHYSDSVGHLTQTGQDFVGPRVASFFSSIGGPLPTP